MSVVPKVYGERVSAAVDHYWQTLKGQASSQGKLGSDRGNRRAVTGGKQMDGFCDLVRWLIAENGMPGASVFTQTALQLPGFFRPTKMWDLLVVHEEHLVAAVEFKSQVGPSFGNNFNNRAEEAIGNAIDIATAYREGAFGTARPRPWVGWLMFLEDCEASARPIRVDEPHFEVFPEFRDASYAKRYELLLRKLTREKCYDGSALVLAQRGSSHYSEPAEDLSTRRFLAGLGGHVRGFLGSIP